MVNHVGRNRVDMILVARNGQLPQCDVEVWLKPRLVLTKRGGMRLITNSISYHYCKDVLALSSVTRRIHWLSGNVLDTLGCMPL